MNWLKTVGDNVRVIRRRRDISQKALAVLVGTSQGYIADIENATANPSLGVLIAIAKHLDIDLLRLFREKK